MTPSSPGSETSSDRGLMPSRSAATWLAVPGSSHFLTLVRHTSVRRVIGQGFARNG